MITIRRISAKVILNLNYSVYCIVKEHRMYVSILMSKIGYFYLFLASINSLINGKLHKKIHQLVIMKICEFSAFSDFSHTTPSKFS